MLQQHCKGHIRQNCKDSNQKLKNGNGKQAFILKNNNDKLNGATDHNMTHRSEWFLSPFSTLLKIKNGNQ